jgi:hypothetical protein
MLPPLVLLSGTAPALGNRMEASKPPIKGFLMFSYKQFITKTLCGKGYRTFSNDTGRVAYEKCQTIRMKMHANPFISFGGMNICSTIMYNYA